MTPQDFEFLRQLLREKSGLSLSNDKQYLIESRLLPIVRQEGLETLHRLVHELRLGRPNLVASVVAAMTTNETFFFRDKLPFEQFRTVMLPELIKTRARTRRLRIWCAAASTGQEPYSLAMILREMSSVLSGWRIDILATDIADHVIEKAKAGLYSQFEAQRGLPIQMLIRHFDQVGEMWQIKQEVRDMVHFRPINLLQDFSALGRFDVVLCRNVLIYFDQPHKAATLGRLARVVAPDGFLVLGSAETVVGLTSSFRPMPDHRGVYRPDPDAMASCATVLKFAGPAR